MNKPNHVILACHFSNFSLFSDIDVKISCILNVITKMHRPINHVLKRF